MTNLPDHTSGASHSDSAAEHSDPAAEHTDAPAEHTDAASIVEDELPDTTDEKGAPVENPSGG